MRARLRTGTSSIRVLLQLKKKYCKACEQWHWDDDNYCRAFFLRGCIMRYGGRRRWRETKVFTSGRNETRRKLNGKGREKWNNLPFWPRIALYVAVLTYVYYYVLKKRYNTHKHTHTRTHTHITHLYKINYKIQGGSPNKLTPTPSNNN